MSDPFNDALASLKREQVIPDVIPADFHPSVLFSVFFPGQKEVKLGSKIPRDETLEEPEIKPISFKPSNLNKTYTLVMTDPDAPSRADPKFGEWRHWVVTGVKFAADTSQAADTKKKTSATAYYPPGPPPGTGFHRYVFLLYQEPEGSITIPSTAPEHSSSTKDRHNWNAMAFAKQHGLQLVGAHYFMTKANE